MPFKCSPQRHGWSASAGRSSTSSGRAWRLRSCMRQQTELWRAGRSPNGRYLLACAALVAMMAAPLTTWELMGPPAASPDAAYQIHGVPPAPSTTSTAGAATLPDSVRAIVPEVQPAHFLAWVVVVWLVGAAALWVRLAGGWVVAARMRSMLVRRAPPEWQQTLQRLGAQIGLSRPVRLLVSALVQVPTVVGWLRPVVLVPVGSLGGLPAEYVEALLLHELAHIRRHDYLVNMLQSVAEALLFYHPAVWWVSGHIRAGRELCCDDVAVSVSGDALTYARALAHLESYHPAHLTAALAATGGSLADRIARLLGQSRPAVRTGLGPGVVTIAVLLVTAGYGLFGQSDAHPAFEVASIKRGASGVGPMDGPMGVSYKPGGRMIAMNAPLEASHPICLCGPRLPSLAAPAGFSSCGRSGLDRFRRLRYRGQARGQHRSEARVADAAIAPGRQIQADAPPGDERTPCIRFDGEKQWHQTAGGQRSKLRFLSARHDAAEHPWVGRLWLCALAGIAHRAADEWKEAAHGGPYKRAGNDTGPAGHG